MIQPEGAADWVYAVEIEQLKDVLKTPADDDDLNSKNEVRVREWRWPPCFW